MKLLSFLNGHNPKTNSETRSLALKHWAFSSEQGFCQKGGKDVQNQVQWGIGSHLFWHAFAEDMLRIPEPFEKVKEAQGIKHQVFAHQLSKMFHEYGLRILD